MANILLTFLVVSYAVGAAVVAWAWSRVPGYDRPWSALLHCWLWSPFLLAAALVLVPCTLLLDLARHLVLRAKGGL